MGRWSKRLHNYCLHTLGKEMSTKSNLYTNWICIELMVRCLNYNQQNWQRMFTTNRWRKWKRNKLQIAYSILGTSIPNINTWKRRRRRRENSLPTKSILYANTYDIIFQALVLGLLLPTLYLRCTYGYVRRADWECSIEFSSCNISDEFTGYRKVKNK